MIRIKPDDEDTYNQEDVLKLMDKWKSISIKGIKREEEE
jgi:hypothetical protein